MSLPKETHDRIRLENLKAALEKGYFEASIHQSLKEAEDYVISSIVPDNGIKSVGFGGSATLAATSLPARLSSLPGLKVVDRNASDISPEERQELSRQTFLTDLFISSANAVTLDGHLVNQDKFGNRVAAMAFGPRKVALLIGRNKIVRDFEAALERIKDIAAPINALRLKTETPCAKTGRCHDCNSEARLCGVLTVIERSFPKKRIHALLINDDLGF
jgi:hypothetical protein